MAKEIQPNTPGYTTVSIYDQTYHLRGQDPNHIRQLADLVDSKMRAVAAQWPHRRLPARRCPRGP